jgi:hypothetical protein
MRRVVWVLRKATRKGNAHQIAARQVSGLEGPALYHLGFGGLLGGWQEPQGLFFVTLSGVASACPEIKVSAAPAISNAAAILDAHRT